MYEKLRYLRKAKDIKVKHICGLLNLKTDAAYFKKESGQTKFTVDEAIAIAKLFDTTVEELFG